MSGNSYQYPIIFYFPYRYPSGVSNLFLRMAEWLSGREVESVMVIDYPDGQMAKNIPFGSKVQLIPFIDGEVYTVPDHAVFLMQAVLPYTLPSNLKFGKATRLIEWHFLYYALVNTLIPISVVRHYQHRHPKLYQSWMTIFQPNLKKAIYDYINGMINKKALIFHDQQIVSQTSKYLDISIENPCCLPVPVRISDYPIDRDFPELIIRCGWVGGLYDFKVHILIHTLQRISLWAKESKSKVEYYIIGDGKEEWRIDKLDIEHEFFHLCRVGTIPSSDLEIFMLEHFDLAFSMGTSALESAAVGIPTSLLDYSLDYIEGKYSYKWLFDSVPGDIGHRIGPNDLEKTEDSLVKLLEEAQADYRGLSKKCYEYCKKYHSIDAIGKRLLDTINSCEYTWDEVPARLRQVSLARRLRNVVRTVRNRT